MSHPEKFKVGSRVEVVRRIGRSVDWRWPGTVIRHTPTLVVVKQDNGAEIKFRAPHYEETPAYLNYVTTIEEVPDDHE